MRHRLRALALLLLAAAAWSSATGAGAQTTTSVTLRLVAQSAWNGPTRPLEISLSATNDSSLPLTSLAVVLSIWTPARSRSVYDLSLKSDVTTVLLSQPFPQKGVLEPGQTRTFAIREPLSGLGATDNALYPVRLQLLSANTPVGAIRTPMIFLIQHPKVPLNLTWTWVLSDPLQFRPDGTFEPGPIENDIA